MKRVREERVKGLYGRKKKVFISAVRRPFVGNDSINLFLQQG